MMKDPLAQRSCGCLIWGMFQARAPWGRGRFPAHSRDGLRSLLTQTFQGSVAHPRGGCSLPRACQELTSLWNQGKIPRRLLLLAHSPSVGTSGIPSGIIPNPPQLRLAAALGASRRSRHQAGQEATSTSSLAAPGDIPTWKLLLPAA